MIKPQTLKGFRDFLPKEAKKRQYVINTLKEVFELYGFEPLETPALELAEILKGKYGEEEKLIYEFKTKGGDEVALRYDQTVPLSRVVVQYENELTFPFKRYQIQNVWRGENTQKGRYREFVQCDADIIGVNSPLADVEIIKLVLDIYSKLGLDITIKINDRLNFEGLEKKFVSAIDKLEKIGESQVLAELVEKGMTDEEAAIALSALQKKPLTDSLNKIFEELKKEGLDMSKIKYEPTLARGLDYYTGMIFETISEGSAGSICSGGRYDKLIGKFSGGKDFPAVGFGLGFDRTIELLEEKNLIPSFNCGTKVLVTIFSTELEDKSVEICNNLRIKNINSELFLKPETDLAKQLKYADQKGIPYVAIIGPDEAKENLITLKKMQDGTSKKVTLENLPDALK